MRIRSTKPEFWRSKTIAALPWDVRLVLKGLESYVDDNGVGKDDIALIAADVFPRDLSRNPRETLARLSEAISALFDAGLIHRYEVDGEELVYIDKWKDLQRIDKPARGRFPRPDGTFEYAEAVNRDSYRRAPEVLASVPEVVAPGTGEQGNRGTGEQGIDITYHRSVPYVPERASESTDDGWDGVAAEVGIEDLEDVRSNLAGLVGDVSRFDALVFAQELATFSLEPVTNLGGYIAVACRDTPDEVRDYYARFLASRLEVTA